MLKTLDFYYPIITHLREQYLKLLPKIEKMSESGYPSVFDYQLTQYCPAYEANVTCLVRTNFYNATVSFESTRLYKGTREQMILVSTHEVRSHEFSNYDGRSLITVPGGSEPYYFVKGNHPTKVFEMLEENNPDDLESMEFMLMSKYDMVDLTAILLNQVLINEDVGIQKYNINLAPFVGIGEEREKALTDLYYSTVIGLEHESSKVD